MTAIQITVALNAQQTSLIIQEVSGVNISGMTDIAIVFKQGATMEAFGSYVMDPAQEAAFVQDKLVEILIVDMFEVEKLEDDWWTIQLTGTAGEYLSNQYGVGVFSDIALAVYSQINSLHVPEANASRVHDLALKSMMLDGLRFLDTSVVNDRGVKFTKRLSALTKIIGI